MFRFLQGYYQRTNSSDVGGLLGSMSLLVDGSTADAAMESDWQAAVAYALAGGEAPLLQITPPGQVNH
jgi:hypothetical protein